MLLAVDIGNTNIVFGLYEGERLVHTFRVSTVRTRTEDEYGVLLLDLLNLRQVSVASIDAAIVASVVPPLTDVMVAAIRHAFSREPLVVGPGLKTGVRILYDNPREIGADRIVNAVAAFERVKGPAIVVDFGTATTFDCISPKGEYLGGVIVPGIQVSLDGLLQSAAKLSRVELAVPERVLGRNTTHALQSGVLIGHAALVDGLLERLEAELGYSSTVIATGGRAGLVAKNARRIGSVDPNLTLEGLRILYEKNRDRSGAQRSPRARPAPESS
ncbi:MAG: type III pantothenate kinase [Pseudomonadota bacterium]|nr:MAG: type III pantothenate kinase [Pseudomonadota bacterium]